MTLLTRRHFMQGAGGLVLGSTGLASYPLAIEPGFCLDVASYDVRLPQWPDGLNVKAAVIADIHACEPLMSASRVRHIAELANRLNPDIVFLLGDFNAGHRYVTAAVYPEQWGEALSILNAPLGAYAILGNHDWWHGALPGMPSDGGESVRRALRHANIAVLENDAVRVAKNGQPFWVVGLGDQLAHRIGPRSFRGIDDLGGTLRAGDGRRARRAAGARALHFPPCARARVAHALRPYAWRTGELALHHRRLCRDRSSARDHIYGHIVEGGRQMIISAGLGTSIVPVRFMRPPEVVSVTIGGGGVATV